MQAFAAGISASPASYMLSPVDATSISNSVAAYASALSTCTTPPTRNAGTINAKDVARASAEALCKQYAILIKYNAGISDQDKIDIGIRPINPSRDPVECPQTSPAVAIVATTQGAQTVEFRDSMDLDRRGKPFGASDLLLFVAVTPTGTTNPDDAKFYAKVTKNPVAVMFEHADNGKQATYFARWSNRRGDMSPWSTPVSMAIAA
jgi:hypothetical protein